MHLRVNYKKKLSKLPMAIKDAHFSFKVRSLLEVVCVDLITNYLMNNSTGKKSEAKVFKFLLERSSLHPF